MTRTKEELTSANQRFEALAEGLNVNSADVGETGDLRAIADAADAVKAAQALLNERVAIARARGRSWNRIAIPLGVSRQAARERFSREGRDDVDQSDAGSRASDLMSALEASLEAVRGADTERREPLNEDAQALANLERARIELSHLGIPEENLTDDQAIALFGRLLRERIPAPAVPAGSPVVNARVWAAAALTAGGFREPEDRRQRAYLGDQGPDVALGVIGILVMRHLSGSSPAGWTDEDLSTKFNELPETFARAQRIVDEAAQDVGRLATPAPRWWLETG